MLLLENANKWIERWIEENKPQYILEYKRTIKYTPGEKKPHRQIKNEVWAEWEQTIKKNCYRFQKAKTYDEIYDTVEGLKIEGIGDETIKATADYLADKQNVDCNSHCLRLMPPKVKTIIKKNHINLESVSYDDFVKKNPLFEKLSMREIIQFLETFSDKFK